MTLIRFANVAGAPRGEPIRLDRRRRRLSTIARAVDVAARIGGGRFIVSVHRGAEADAACVATDATVRLRKAWRRTLVGPRDVVLITLLPLGGGGRGGGGKSMGGIALGLASIALIALAPYAAPALLPTLILGTTPAFLLQAGMVIGGIALGAAAQNSASANKTNTRSLYTVGGGGNVPKPGARRPILYGRCWSAPPLSQQDYFTYDGDVNVLVKRMTLGLGKYRIHAVRVGDALFWSEAGGLQAPFNSTIDGPYGTAIEFLHASASGIAPGDATTSQQVAGIEMPRPGGNPDWSPWYRLTAQGAVADAAQMSWTYPSIYREASSGRQAATVAGVVFQGQRIDPATGNAIGGPVVLWRSDETNALTTTPLRRSAYFRLPQRGGWLVRAQNLYPAPVGFTQENRATWDAMTAFRDDTRIRPNTTEIVMRVRAGAGLSVTSFSDVMVEASRILPVWDGHAWSEQVTSKAVWAYADLVRAEHGLDLPDGFDAAKAAFYAGDLRANDTYDGPLPEVSSFWEAASAVLHPLRSDPVKVGAIHSFVRDESRGAPRHVLSRRQIVMDTGQESYSLASDAGDVIVEFNRDGDPKRPDEARFSYGPASRTPKRYRVEGIRDGAHALKHATWLAAIGVFRGAERKVTTEWDGRLVYPGDHVLADLWFLKGKQAAGVIGVNGLVLRLDVRLSLPAEWGYASIRTRAGREWGILRVRGAGTGALEVHSEDVAALSGQTGLSLSAVLARETQDPTTIVLGELAELQETYVVRAAIPADADHVQIEMVNDDPRVWQLLDEDVAVPQPVDRSGLEEPLVPVISVLHARCVRIETGIEVVWGVSTTRGARNYEATLSYDGGATAEVLSPFSPVSSGRAALRQSDQPVTVSARAFGRTGLPGPWISTTFTTIAPAVDGAHIVPFSIDYAAFTDSVLANIKRADEALDLAGDALAEALSALDGVKGNAAEIISEAQKRLTEDQAIVRTVDAALARIGTNEAAIVRIDQVSATREEATARSITALNARVDTAQSSIVSVEQASVTRDNAQVSSINALVGRMGTAEGSIVTEQTVRANADGALSGRLDAVQAKADGNAAAIVNEASARANADGALAGQTSDLYARSDYGTASGRFGMGAASVGGDVSVRIFAVASVIRGSAQYGAGWYLDLLNNGQSRYVVDANSFYITANGSTTPAFSFDGATLTIPSLRVTNSAILPNAVSQSRWDYSPGGDLNVPITVRGGARVSVMAQFDGAPGTPLGLGATGRLQILRDGVLIRDTPINFYIAGNNDSRAAYSLQTSTFVVDSPGGGGHTYTVRTTNGQGPVACLITELAA